MEHLNEKVKKESDDKDLDPKSKDSAILDITLAEWTQE